MNSNESLNGIEKLDYLRLYMEGPTAAMITGLALTWILIPININLDS